MLMKAILAVKEPFRELSFRKSKSYMHCRNSRLSVNVPKSFSHFGTGDVKTTLRCMCM